MNPERVTTTLEGRDLAAVTGGSTRVQIAAGEAISPLMERETQEAHMMNMLTATILVLGPSADGEEINTVTGEASRGNYQSITDLFHRQTPEVCLQIAEKVEHVNAVNHYVALGVIRGYWGEKGEIGEIFTPEPKLIDQVRMGFLLNGNMPNQASSPQGVDFAQAVAEVEKRASLSDFDREKIHDLELELAHRVPRLQELSWKPRENYLQLLFERNLVVEGAYPFLTHAVANENGNNRVIPVKAAVTKLRRHNGGRRLVTLLKPIDENGNVIPLESLSASTESSSFHSTHPLQLNK